LDEILATKTLIYHEGRLRFSAQFALNAGIWLPIKPTSGYALLLENCGWVCKSADHWLLGTLRFDFRPTTFSGSRYLLSRSSRHPTPSSSGQYIQGVLAFLGRLPSTQLGEWVGQTRLLCWRCCP
jgi:hypothetical protein